MSKRNPANPTLPFDDPAPGPDLSPDAADRTAAVDPRLNVVLEASAGTGKTRVLVDRYTNLVAAGVEPKNILAITFTRKAAAEMRERILANLRRAAEQGSLPPARWRALRDHLGDVAISTIDAFCLSLLREFPLEADLDPGFGMADETEALRLTDEALDRTMRICRAVALDDPSVALVLARLGDRQLRDGLAGLIDRRLVAAEVLARAVRPVADELTPERVARAFLERLARSLGGVGLEGFLSSGPTGHPRFRLLAADLRRTMSDPQIDGASLLQRTRLIVDGIRDYFLTREGTPRKRSAYTKEFFSTDWARRRHQELASSIASRVAEDLAAFRRDLNAVLTRGVWRLFGLARTEYRRTLDQHAVVDFPEALARALELLGAMDEFTESRFLLESRYHHLLVDEFQDTSEAQWRLVWQLVQSWREGLGVAQDLPLQPTIFVVGDRKQSIYGFRDADVGVLLRAAGYIGQLRGDGASVRRAIRRSFRAVPGLLAFTNALCDAIDKAPERTDAFTFEETDRFPIDAPASSSEAPVLGLIAAPDSRASAMAVAAEIERLLAGETVRDRQTGVARAARPGDCAVLFRTRDGHQDVEAALADCSIPSYVYKGLGFFDADEIKDVIALLRFLADPSSDLRAAALLRSRFVRLSDRALSALAPNLARAIVEELPREADLDPDDRAVMTRVRATVPTWMALADRIPPAELLDRAIRESAYLWEIAGPRREQARENLKKMRALVRRIQNRGYATLARLTEHVDRLSAGDESNAAIDAADAVNLMTVHAAKGLEFPIVFVVNLSKGSGGARAPIRFSSGPEATTPVVAIGDFRSEADEDAAAREREESKRLLYVAVTRARDRLYLATTLTKGIFAAARGGLGEILPAEFRNLFAEAALQRLGEIAWTTANGVHRFRICPPPGLPATDVASFSSTGQSAPRGASQAGAGPYESQETVAASLAAIPTLRRARVTEVPHDAAEVGIAESRGSSDPSGARLVGSLVHRLLAAPDVERSTPEQLRDMALALVRWDERRLAVNIREVADVAAQRCRALVRRPDVAALFSTTRRWHEVPVALREGDSIYRGAIDTIVEAPDGTLHVLEFKTGQPTRAHEIQLARYVAAARALFPDRRVAGAVVYAAEALGIGLTPELL
jgi:ATP-dependent exoDNAse (exonuclease V) beta subunit